MLDGILGRGFSAKCKSLIKQTKNRIDVIRRKRNATLRFLKKDIADLLSNGLDINAYGRAEGLLSELTLSSCYDFVEQSCDFLMKHLSVMQKVRYCPEDCRGAVSSLMFAAARFSDLPELRELRQEFYDRYGNSLELFVNQEFLENLSPKTFTMDKKVKLMQDIATEFSIIWDSRAFEQRMSRPPAIAQNQQKGHASVHASEDRQESTNGRNSVPSVADLGLFSNGRFEHTNKNDGCKLLINEKENKASQKNQLNQGYGDEVSNNRHKYIAVVDNAFLKVDSHATVSQFKQEAGVENYEPLREGTLPKPVRLGSSSQRKQNCVDEISELYDGSGMTLRKRDDQDNLPHGKPDLQRYAEIQTKNDEKQFPPHNSSGGQHTVAIPRREIQEEAPHNSKPSYRNSVPPPYTKSSSKTKDENYAASLGSPQIGGSAIVNSSSRDNLATVRDWSLKNHQAARHPEYEGLDVGVTRTDGHTLEYYQDKNPIPKPRPSRRRHTKSQSSNGDAGFVNDKKYTKRRSRSRRRDYPRQGLQILFDDEQQKNDEEERIIDRLLMHYSKKPSANEPGKGGRKPRNRNSHHQGAEVGGSPHNVTMEGEPYEISETVAPPRSISLPREQTDPPELKVFTRAASFQPDRSSPARHVHPKLPDYDDLAARFAALKGR